MPPTTRRVLIPADTPQRSRLARVLRDNGWTPFTYDDVAKAETALSRAPASVIILRGPAGKAKPAELVRKFRRVCPDAFVLRMGKTRVQNGVDSVVSESSTPEQIARAVQLGGAMRDARAAERTLRQELETLKNQSRHRVQRIRELEANLRELELQARSAQELALRDELTGLYNRRYFLQISKQQVQRSLRENSRFAVAMIDIDHFKRQNDSHGHMAGDHLLKQFARTLLENVRRMDTVARYGGEEFAILLPQVHGTRKATFDPARLTERLRVAVENQVFRHKPRGKATHMTFSAGVALFPKDGKTIADLIAKVDTRLYAAKTAGRNRIRASDR